MNKQIEMFSSNPPIKFLEDRKWLLVVTSSQCTNFVFKITNENISLPFTIPGQWGSKSAEKNH